MSDKKRKVPKLRFPGFTDEWEQRKLGEIYQVNNERNGNQYSVEKTISIATMTFNESGNGADEKSLPNYKVIRIGDIAFEGHTNKEFRYGRFVLNDLENGLMSPRFTTLRPIIEQEFSFWKYYIHSERVMRSKLVASTKAGTMMNELVADDFFNQTILVPSLPEQEVIGNFFRNLDNLITLHQRKSENLQKLKKGLLQKMFPKNKECVPELRFPGFADTWEQRKAADIAEYSKGNGYSKNDLTEAGTPIILYGRLYTKYQFAINKIDTFAIPRNGAVYSRGNEVIVPASGETAEDIARASAVEISGVLLGGDLNILRPFNFINPLFLALVLSSGEPQKELAKRAQGKSVVHVHNSDIQGITISYPSRAEQDRIIDIFRNLDNLITLHQRKLEHLEDLKKGLLQQMFI